MLLDSIPKARSKVKDYAKESSLWFVAALSNTVGRLAEHVIADLYKQGFQLHNIQPKVPACPADKQLFVHCCCEPFNALSGHMSRTWEVLNVTKECDFTDPSMLRKIKTRLRGPGDVLFYSSPCTGGCPWHRITLARSDQTSVFPQWPGWRIITTSTGDYGPILRRPPPTLRKVGAAVILEWPRGCSYWSEPRVHSFMQRLQGRFAEFDGCMYGLSPIAKGFQDLRIKKPWRMACINTCLPERFNRRCDGRHVHLACEGAEVLHTQGYTPEICKIIRSSLKQYAKVSCRLKAAPRIYYLRRRLSCRSGALDSSPNPLPTSPCRGACAPHLCSQPFPKQGIPSNVRCRHRPQLSDRRGADCGPHA